MTQREYALKLQQALAVTIDLVNSTAGVRTLAGGSPRWGEWEGLSILMEALRLPVPGDVQDLHSITDAPTDGKPFLIYDARHKAAKIACLISKNPSKWRVSDDTLRYTLEDLREEFIGWLPLPKINL